MQSWVSPSSVSCLNKFIPSPPLILHFIAPVFLFQTLAETLSHLLWGKQRFSELISWQEYTALLNTSAASVLLPIPALKRKKSNSQERKTKRKKGREAKITKALSVDGQTIRHNIRVWEVDVKVDLFVLVREDCWNEVCFVSHIAMTSFPRLLNNNTINNQAGADCLGKLFPWVQQNTLHYTPKNVIILLCYVVTQSWESPGVGRVCLQTLHKHICIHTPIWSNNQTITEVICRSIMLIPLKLVRDHCGHNAYRSFDGYQHTQNHNTQRLIFQFTIFKVSKENASAVSYPVKIWLGAHQ